MKKRIIFIFTFLGFLLTGSIHAQNLLPHWDANGLGLNEKSIAGTEMFRWGWYSNAGGYNWGTANAGAGNIRFCDAPTIHANATMDGLPYVGRFAQLRWDGNNGANESSYTILGYGDGTAAGAGTPDPIQLIGGRLYNFSFGRYPDGKAIYVKMYITTEPAATDESKTIATIDINDPSNTNDLKFHSFDFICPQTDGYYFVFKYVSGDTKILYMTDIDLHMVTIPMATAATDISTTGFTANWSSVAGAAGYILDVALDEEFTNFVEGHNNLEVNGTSKTITGLTSETTYYYRVRAEIESVESQNSNIISVTTISHTIPAYPHIHDVTDISPVGFTASWNAVEDIISYHIDIALDESFTEIVPQYENYTVNTNSCNVKGLNPYTIYYYRIRSYNGSFSEYSAPVALRTHRLLIVLMAGQSNMAGRGNYSELAPVDTITYDHILYLDKDSAWVKARHPLHWDKSEAGVGMGIEFARTLAEKIGDDVFIGLVPCAAGGTSISQWLNDEWFGYTANHNLYTNLIIRAGKAASGGNIIGLIWHQGESDATSGTSYLTYQERLETFFRKVRTDLNIPSMPVVAGELGEYLKSNSSYIHLAEINAAMHALTDILPAYGVASSEGLTPNSDNVHFTASSLIEFGKRYADILYSMYDESVAMITSLVVNDGILSPGFNPDITEYTCYVNGGNSTVKPVVTYIGDELIGDSAVDISSGSGTSVITVVSANGANKIYTINYVAVENTDYTHLIINNDFDLAPDPSDCSKSVAVTAGIDGWVNDAFRPAAATCKQIYGWTFDVDYDELGNNSQGINANSGGTKHGDWACWIAGDYQLPNELHEFYQVIDKELLTAGTYKLECIMGVAHSKLTTQRIFANNNVQYHGKENQYESNLTLGEFNTFAGHSTGENILRDMFLYVTIGENDSLKIGIRTGNKRSDDSVAPKANPMWGWFKTDYFRLTKIDPVIAGNAELADISLSAGTLDFSPRTTHYNVSLPQGTKSVSVSVIPCFEDVIISGDETVDVSKGEGVSNIVVTALDRITTKTYTINYKVDSSANLNDLTEAKTSCYVNGNKLIVKGTEAYIVYSVNGTKVVDIHADISTSSIELNPGVYIVKTKEAETFKVVVR